MPKEATFKAAPTRVDSKTRPRRRSLLPLADSYLFWGVFGSTIRGLGWFAGLFLAFAVVTSAQRIAQRSFPLKLALELILYQLPRIVLFTIPAALLFGVVSAFTEMSSKGEVTAFMVGGMSLKRMLRAPLMLAAVLGLFAFWLQEVIVPGAELNKGNAVARSAQSLVESQGFRIVDPPQGHIEQVVQAEAFDVAKQILVKPVFQLYREDNTIKTQFQADSARWNPKSKEWVLKNAVINSYPVGQETFSFQSRSPETTVKSGFSPAAWSLKNVLKEARDQIEAKNFEMVSWQQLAAYRAEKLKEYATATGNQRKGLRKEIRAETYGIHDKWAMPLVVLSMVLFGAPLGVRPQRTASAGLAMGLSLMVMLSYYFLWTFCTQIGKAGTALPELIAYIPPLTLTAIGTVLIVRKS